MQVGARPYFSYFRAVRAKTIDLLRKSCCEIQQPASHCSARVFVSASQFMGRCVESSLESALLNRFLRRGHAVLTAARVKISYITLIYYNRAGSSYSRASKQPTRSPWLAISSGTAGHAVSQNLVPQETPNYFAWSLGVLVGPVSGC